MTHDEYVTLDGVNWSALKHIWNGSLLHYFHRGEDEDTSGRAMGREVHRLVLEPDSELDYVVWEGGDRRGKAWKEFEAAHPGRTIFKPAEVSACYRQAEAIVKHPVARELLKGCQFETPIQWVDPVTRLKCKARLDAHRDILIDLKGCSTTDPIMFGREAAKAGYHCQLAHYGNGLEGLNRQPPAATYIIAVETNFPHDVAVFRLPKSVIEVGAEEVAGCLYKLSKAIRSGKYPGRCEVEQELSVPNWVYGDDAISISGGN